MEASEKNTAGLFLFLKIQTNVTQQRRARMRTEHTHGQLKYVK